MEHNIEKEKKFIELLGYHVVGPDHSNRWLIMDENNNEVGYIQYKKIKKEHKKKGVPAIFGYVTKIDSDTIYYDAIKVLEEVNNDYLNYTFDIKLNNGDTDHVEMSLGISPSIIVWSSTYGFMDFGIGYKGLHCSFTSKTENYNIEETIIVQPERPDYLKQYAYCLTVCDKDKDITDTNEKITSDIQITDSTMIGRQIEIEFKKWVNGVLKRRETVQGEGTLLETIKEHQDGLDAFSHFRYLINKIVPFQEEVITSILKERGITEPEYLLFFPELVQPQMTSTGETIEEQGPNYVKE